MDERFSTILLQDAKDFLASLDSKARKKILFNIWKSKAYNDKTLFKPLSNEIWEFRTLYNKQYLRLFAFWDKTDKESTLVIATHGIVKKSSKIPIKEIKRAVAIRAQYFENENSEDEKV